MNKKIVQSPENGECTIIARDIRDASGVFLVFGFPKNNLIYIHSNSKTISTNLGKALIGLLFCRDNSRGRRHNSSIVDGAAQEALQEVHYYDAV